MVQSNMVRRALNFLLGEAQLRHTCSGDNPQEQVHLPRAAKLRVGQRPTAANRFKLLEPVVVYKVSDDVHSDSLSSQNAENSSTWT